MCALYSAPCSSPPLPPFQDAGSLSGVIMVRDTVGGPDPDAAPIAAPVGGKDESEDGVEPNPPEPFEWTVGDYWVDAPAPAGGQ